MGNIKSITPIGKHQTYDLEVDHPDHQFYLANGVLTSNSHAVAYAIDSFWCSWLLTYHEEQWLTAYVESMLNNPDKKAKAFGELKRLGYVFVPIDINYATTEWTVLPGKKFMPSLISCKGVGDTAAQEIIASRPYESIEKIFWNEDGSWKPSKFNKKSLDALIKVGAFGSLDIIGDDKLFKSYGHMHHVMIENNDLIKKSPKKDPFLGMKTFYELARTTRDEVEDWSKKELVEMQVEVFGSLDVTALIDPEIILKLDEKGIKPLDEWEEKNFYWFAIKDSRTKKTKNGKAYLQVEAVSISGKVHRMNVWGAKEDQSFEPYTVVFAEVDRNDFGFSTSMWRCKVIS
jgi:DNA polymerase III alpha subunit